MSVTDENVSEHLTILITTSPTKHHPSTDLLEIVLSSLQLIDHLNECRKIIICDGYNVKEKEHLKVSQITEDMVSNYENYKLNLQQKINEGHENFYKSELLILPNRFGFAFALKEALTQLVTTEYVMVIQHDRCFVREFNLLGTINAMKTNEKMRYVLLPTGSTLKYRNRMCSKFERPDMLKGNEVYFEDLVFLPLLQIYDSSHIATVDFYLNFIFANKYVAKSGFIEDKLGGIQVTDIKLNGFAAHTKYGTYLYGDGSESVVQHLDGRCGLAAPQFTWEPDPRGGFKRSLII